MYVKGFLTTGFPVGTGSRFGTTLRVHSLFTSNLTPRAQVMKSLRAFQVAFFNASGDRTLLIALVALSEDIAAFRATRIARQIAAANFRVTLGPQSTCNKSVRIAFHPTIHG